LINQADIAMYRAKAHSDPSASSLQPAMQC
jgi:hypothetical protein